MQLRIVRRIPLTEVTDRVKQYEKQFGASLDDVSNKFAKKALDQEAFDYLTEDILDLDPPDLSKLTPKRLELLDQMSRHNADSINELASTIGRDVKNVYNDLKTLESLGLIELVKDGRRMIPGLLVKEITFLTW